MKGILPIALLGLQDTQGMAQQPKKFNVAIFLYQGVELLDFAGPAETFSATPDFNAYTVSADGKEILSQGFVTIKPQYPIDEAPVPDIVVFPGGNREATSNNQKVLDWVNSLYSQKVIVMSVCNGAGILAKAGLLNGLVVTTHHSFITGLRKMLPNSTVLDDTKYVDNGNIITTAGVSSGIDGALHIISRIKGRDVARSVAYYMEYNKWTPEGGMTIYRNEYIEKWRDEAIGIKLDTGKVSANAKIPYEGELKNLGMELLEKGKYQKTATVMEQAVKWYPYSGSSYSILGKAYLKLGRPAPIDEDQFVSLIDSGNVDEAVLVYESTRRDFPGWQLFDESTIASEGNRFLRNKDYTAAVKVFSLNCQAFPSSRDTWNDLAGANLKAGNKEAATPHLP